MWISNIIVCIAPFIMCICLMWLNTRSKQQQAELRTKVMLAAIEKDDTQLINQIVKSLTQDPKPLREKLINRIHGETLAGWTLTLLGGLGMVAMLIMFVYSISIGKMRDGFFVMMLVCLPFFATGVGLLVAARQAKQALTQLKD